MKGSSANGLNEAIDRFNQEIQLARASELALSGRLLQAEALLVSKERFPNTWEELDLLARIRVREGKLADALQLWGRGATIPTHSSRAHACIASLQNYAAAKFKRDRQMFIVLWALWSSVVIGVVAVFVLRGFR
jgi:hypothetical protein